MAENAENPEVIVLEEPAPKFIVRSYRKVKKAVTSTPGKVALTLGGTAAGAFATYYLGFAKGSDHAVGVMSDLCCLPEDLDEDSDDSEDETEETDDSTTNSTEE